MARNAIKKIAAIGMLVVATSASASTLPSLPSNLTNTLSFLLGNEQDFRNMDHASYLTTGFELNNLYRFNNQYVELDNLLSFGPYGDYYILNNYSTDSTYYSRMYKYVLRLTTGYSFELSNHQNLELGAGVGYRYLRYRARYNEQGVTTVYNRYIEYYIPLEINYHAPLSGDYSMSFKNIIPIGLHGKMTHIFSGPQGFTQPSYHDSIGIITNLLLNYKSYSFGPWFAYNYLTTGSFGGHPTVTSGNQLKIVEFGLRFDARV